MRRTQTLALALLLLLGLAVSTSAAHAGPDAYADLAPNVRLNAVDGQTLLVRWDKSEPLLTAVSEYRIYYAQGDEAPGPRDAVPDGPAAFVCAPADCYRPASGSLFRHRLSGLESLRAYMVAVYGCDDDGRCRRLRPIREWPRQVGPYVDGRRLSHPAERAGGPDVVVDRHGREHVVYPGRRRDGKQSLRYGIRRPATDEHPHPKLRVTKVPGTHRVDFEPMLALDARDRTLLAFTRARKAHGDYPTAYDVYLLRTDTEGHFTRVQRRDRVLKGSPYKDDQRWRLTDLTARGSHAILMLSGQTLGGVGSGYAIARPRHGAVAAHRLPGSRRPDSGPQVARDDSTGVIYAVIDRWREPFGLYTSVLRPGTRRWTELHHRRGTRSAASATITAARGEVDIGVRIGDCYSDGGRCGLYWIHRRSSGTWSRPRQLPGNADYADLPQLSRDPFTGDLYEVYQYRHTGKRSGSLRMARLPDGAPPAGWRDHHRITHWGYDFFGGAIAEQGRLHYWFTRV